MTLSAYDAERLDQFALRLLDLAAAVRHMAQRSREFELDGVGLHDKKAMEWIANLERWASKSVKDLEVRVLEVRAGRRAASLHD